MSTPSAPTEPSQGTKISDWRSAALRKGGWVASEARPGEQPASAATKLPDPQQSHPFTTLAAGIGLFRKPLAEQLEPR